MPPFVSRKRCRERDDADSSTDARPDKRVAPSNPDTPTRAESETKKGQQSLFETLDRLPKSGRSVEDNKAYVQAQDAQESEDDDELDEEEFEDVPGVGLPIGSKGRRRGATNETSAYNLESSEGDEDEEADWEDALPLPEPDKSLYDQAINDISITLGAPDPNSSAAKPAFSDARAVAGKKGPSKIERQIRLNTHCMHVLFLLHHNLVRNGWVEDKQLQQILLNQLSDGVRREVERWKIACGMSTRSANTETRDSRGESSSRGTRSKGKSNAKGQAQEYIARGRTRDWGPDAERLEVGVPDLSHGDPTIRLLKFVAAYWQKRFRVIAPSLQKRGYLPPAELETKVRDYKNWLEGDEVETTAARFGERMNDKEAFLDAAKKCSASRDVGAQLFTALLRGIGLEARMVASLQPVGFGFSKAEDGVAIGDTARKRTAAGVKEGKRDQSSKRPSPAQSRNIKTTSPRQNLRVSASVAPISLDTSSSDELSDALSDSSKDSDLENASSGTNVSQASNQLQKDAPCPTYWTEVVSPIDNSIIPVVSLPSPFIANSAELLASFTPGGKAAEKAKLVFAYVVAYSSDGTAKDVTVRYLKKKLWPGKTRGLRVPKEKLPIYNNDGRVKKWIEWDWFGQAIGAYAKDPREKADWEQIEDEFDLVPMPAGKRDAHDANGDGTVGGKAESLQAYKDSAEFVLERHLRREEAIVPGSEPARQFTWGKGDNATTAPVYRRADVVICKTVESWHKEGRRVKDDEEPLKQVRVRAMTLVRKREAEEIQRETGERPMQGLFAEAQTEWIIPDPIGPDRKIPKNVFGNIDVYVPSMVPEGAVHLPLKGSAKLCKRFDIDFAEACTGFEFGKQRAIPVLTGVVVAEENGDLVRDAWREEQQRLKEKQIAKRRAEALAMWKKFYTSLKITEKMKDDYGHGR